MNEIEKGFWLMLPAGLEEVFSLAKFERNDNQYDIWLDEKKERSDEDRRNDDIVAQGFTEYVTVQDSSPTRMPTEATIASMCSCSSTRS